MFLNAYIAYALYSHYEFMCRPGLSKTVVFQCRYVLDPYKMAISPFPLIY